MVCFPPSKINLGLQVVARRPDGYHDVITCYYPLPLTDVLEIIPAREFSFRSTGLAIAGPALGNLCVKAYELMRADFDLPPVSIHLHKIIPMGAGLGGGSSDGAWTLRTLNTIFQLALTPDQLTAYAARLGSDCAFFISDRPKLGRGRGELLSDIDVGIGGKCIVVVKPDVHVSTADAYALLTPQAPAFDLKKNLESFPPDAWSGRVTNDFEEPVFRKFPVVAAIKEQLLEQGALFASMSGSGAAVFGIFPAEVQLAGLFREHFYFSAVAKAAP